MPAEKRFVPINEEIIAEAVKLAEKSGLPLRDFIERVLGVVIGFLKYRPDLLDLIQDIDVIEDLRRIGGVILPYSIVYEIIDKIDEKHYTKIVDEVKKMASWYGLVAKAKFTSDINVLKRALNIWLPDMKIDISKIDNERYRIVATSPNQPERVTRIAREIVESLAQSMDLKLETINGSKGILSVVINTAPKT